MQKLSASLSPLLRSSTHHSTPVRLLRYSTTASSPPHFLPAYLVKECGLSPDRAAKAAERFPRRVLSPDQPDSVISFFKSRGFNDSHLKRLISLYPLVLALRVEENLSPRFRSFHELGFLDADLVKVLCSNPFLLVLNMEENIVPKIKFWRNLLGSDRSLIEFFRRSKFFVCASLNATNQNVTTLRECGLSDHQICAVLKWQPSIISQSTKSFSELVSRVEKLGLSRGFPNFHWALYTLKMVSDDNLRAKIELFKGFGWSEDDFSKAFRNSPVFVTSSGKVLMQKMEFFVNEAGCTASYMARNPSLLCFSLKKRLIPRLKVLRALKEKGLKGGEMKLTTLIKITNKEFFKKYVAPNKESIPELSELFVASS